jgi:hypothetical protein
MPNGHGGHVRFFSMIVLTLFAAGLLIYARKTGAEWAVYSGYGLAVLIGERFAHHLHLWHVDEYVDWSDDEKAAARKTYIIGAIIYVIGAVVAWNFLTTK